MAERERLGRASAKTLRIGTVLIPKTLAGQVVVTGSATIAAAGFVAVSSVQATLGQAPASGESFVAATWAGTTVTLTVYTSADAASTTATVVNYAIFGS